MWRSRLYWDDLNVKLWENHSEYVLVRHLQQAGFQFLNFWRRSGPSLPYGSCGVSPGQRVTNRSAMRSLTRFFLSSPINWNLWSSAQHMLTPDRVEPLIEWNRLVKKEINTLSIDYIFFDVSASCLFWIWHIQDVLKMYPPFFPPILSINLRAFLVVSLV